MQEGKEAGGGGDEIDTVCIFFETSAPIRFGDAPDATAKQP